MQQANNSLAPRQGQAPAKKTFSAFITSDGIRKRINEMMGGKDGQRFTTAIVSAVTNNPALAECDHMSIFSAAMLGESLNLSPSPQLGQYYLVPFKDRKNNRVVATFVLGYKGYIQLAIRSGQYKKLNVLAIKEGELKHYDPLFEELEVDLIQDDMIREQTPTIGYYAMFEYLNGFRKTMYWSKEKMEAHADKFSQAFNLQKYHDLPAGGVEALPYNERWKYSSFWYKDFDGMAYKTMLRQIISKWGIMSIEMQQAMAGDNAMLVNGVPQYIDTDPVPPASAPEPEPEQQPAPEPDGQEEDDFFVGAEGQAPQAAAAIEDEAVMGDEYNAKNAAERKAALLEKLNRDMGIPLEKLESYVGMAFAQWTKKHRLALINVLQRIGNGEDPVTVLQKAA